MELNNYSGKTHTNSSSDNIAVWCSSQTRPAPYSSTHYSSNQMRPIGLASRPGFGGGPSLPGKLHTHTRIYITWRDNALHTKWYFIALHCIALGDITLHRIAPHYSTSHHVALHHITLHTHIACIHAYMHTHMHTYT